MPQGKSVSGGVTIDGKPISVDEAISQNRDAALSGRPLSLHAILEKWAVEAFETLISKWKLKGSPSGHNRQKHTVKIMLEPGDWVVERTDHEAVGGPKTTKSRFTI